MAFEVYGLPRIQICLFGAYCDSAPLSPWEAVSLDMTAHWTPTARSYFGRVTKPHILAAVREATSIEAAEHLLVGTGWLPELMRTPRAAQEPTEQP
jgi:ParB family transcriptional regulator, chromosome partitioning protein